jgi:hypothetical protein
MTRAGLLAVICAMASCAHAATLLHWSELPKALKGKTVEITTIHGVTLRGRLVGLRSDAVVVEAGKEIEVTRDTVSSIFRVGRESSHFAHIKNLGVFVLFGYLLPFTGFEEPPKPALALLTIPLSTAAGAIGAPICLIWDLVQLTEKPWEEIVILPDPIPGVTP